MTEVRRVTRLAVAAVALSATMGLGVPVASASAPEAVPAWTNVTCLSPSKISKTHTKQCPSGAWRQFIFVKKTRVDAGPSAGYHCTFHMYHYMSGGTSGWDQYDAGTTSVGPGCV
ncbi:hypothetical protein [Streptomyces rishiriensis]|uniref:hypothetical protein n=1 Tax=Streptomyces rishiriensis TaxID=68264 RepID=UPI000D59992A|nr:hypothetical protein [Streptomyces rishiriensis]